MIGFDTAIALLRAEVAPLPSEMVPLAQAAGRTLAEPLVARCDTPRSAVSAMDGYAVIRHSVAPGKPFAIIGESRAGAGFDGILAEGEAVRIFTGARLPKHADFVIIQEEAVRTGDTVQFAEGFGPASHVRTAGSDFREGEELVGKGTRLGPRAMVAAAAADVAQVVVAKQPRVAIFATGDELAPPGSAYEMPDAIPESVSFGVAAMAEECGAQVVSRRTGADELADLIPAAGAALDEADLVIVTGGASVGDRDFARPMFIPHGLSLIFDKVAIKPGKPVWLGRAGETLVLGLPGNPTSAMVTAALFLRPLLARLQGAPGELPWRNLPLSKGIAPTRDRETFVRARWDGDGLVTLGNQDSGAQAMLSQADWLIRCPAHQPELTSGTMVDALPF